MASEPTDKNPQDDAMTMGVTPDELATGIILDGSTPFAGKRPANARFKELGLPAGEWQVAEYGDGFAIRRIVDPAGEGDTNAVLPVAKAGPEAHFWVRFHAKSNPMDPEDVVLAVNHEVLQIQRNVKVPMPQRFLEAADHALHKHYTQQPGKDRKVDSVIRKYTYDVLGPATRADFVNFKRAGTRSTREHAEKLGIALEA